MSPATRQHKAMGVVAALALAVRLARLLDARAGDPLYSAHLLDSAFYHDMAQRILASGPIQDGPFLMAPLYGYFLAAVYAVAGVAPTPVYAIQVLFGTASAVLATWLGWRHGKAVAGWTAGLAVALYPVSVLYDVRLLSVSLAALLTTAAAVLLQRAWDAPERPARAAWAGLVLGLAATARANLLLALPVLLLASAIHGWKQGRTLAATGLLALGMAMPLALTTGHNAAVGAGFVPVSVNGGINLYRGNNPLFIDSAVHPFRLPGDKDALATRSRLVASIESDRWLTVRETDRYWVGRTLGHWREDPARYLGLFGRKAAQTLGYREVGDNVDLTAVKASSAVLRWLPPLFGPMSVLALVGAFVAAGGRRWRREDWPPLILVVIGVASVALFFFVSRYRVPLVPLFAAYAGVAVSWGVQRWRLGERRALAMAAVAATLLGGLLAVPPTHRLLPWSLLAERGAVPVQPPCSVDEHAMRDPVIEADFKLAVHAMLVEDWDDAERRLADVLRRDPGHTPAGVDLSFVLLRKGDAEGAAGLAAKVIEQDRCDDKAWSNLGTAMLYLGRPADAAPALAKATELEPYDPALRATRGEVLRQLGHELAAREDLQWAIRWGPELWQPRAALGRLELEKANYDEAIVQLTEAARLAPERPDVEALRGLALVGAGRVDEARESLARAEQLNPDHIAVKVLSLALSKQPATTP